MGRPSLGKPGPFEAFAATALAVVRSQRCTGQKTPSAPLPGAFFLLNKLFSWHELLIFLYKLPSIKIYDT